MSEKLYTINGVAHTSEEWEDIYNLKWATIQYNLRNNKELKRKDYPKVMIDGTEYSITQLSRKTGIRRETLCKRYYAGLRGEELIEEPIKKITYNGKTMTLKQWADELHVPLIRLYKRIDRGWTDEEIIAGKKYKSSPVSSE